MKLKHIALAVALACSAPIAADDSIMLEVGWRFDNQVRDRSAIDFGAIRLRHDDVEVHVATWDGTFAVGAGYVLDKDDSNDGYVSFTPGIAYTTDDSPVRLFYRGAVGYADGDFNYELAHTAYMPLAGDSDAFGTVSVTYVDEDDNGNTPRSNNDDVVADGGLGDGETDNGGNTNDAGSDSDGAGECKPGYGYGDSNCHSGAPGQN